MQRIIVILSLFAFGASGAAARGFDQIPPGKWWENERVVRELKLSEEQQRLIHDRVYEHAVLMIDLKAAVERSELILADTADRDDVEPAAIRKAFNDFQQSRLALESARFEMLLAVRQLLNGEQWRQLQEMRERFEQRRADPRAPMGRPRGPDGAPPRRGGTRQPPQNPMP